MRGKTAKETKEKLDKHYGPSDAVTEENFEIVHEMVKVRELADVTKINTECIRHILGDIVHMKKIFSRWVPHMLTLDQKHERESTVEIVFRLSNAESEGLLTSIGNC